MRRALDTARSELETLNDRDAILDCYFEQTRRLFQFSVLFLVRGDTAHGRNVHGIGAPDGLVSRLTFSLNEPGILSRARELRRPFVGGSTGGEADTRLFGSLARMMPAVLVVPLVVRSRVVAIVLGDGPAEVLNKRAHEASRPPVDIAKEEMLLWSESVSEALERVILKKKSTPGSTPPQRPSWGPPRAPGAPDVGSLVQRAPPQFDMGASAAPPSPSSAAEMPVAASALPQPAPSRRNLVIGLAAVGVLGIAFAGVMMTRTDPDAERVVLRGDKLAGWPSAVDPMTVLEAARGATALSGRPELATIRAELTTGGKVDFGSKLKNDAGVFLTFSFVTKDGESDVRIDTTGVHAARPSGVKRCDRELCRAAAPPPQCSFAQIWDAALAAGALPSDRAFATYGVEGKAGAAAKPEWIVSVVGRGEARVDAVTCKPMPHERLRPPAVPVTAIPGAPREVAPLAILDLARTQSGLDADATLLEVDARGVGSNGRVDLTAGDNGIVYTFSDPASSSSKPRFRTVSLGKDGFPVTPADNDQEARPARFFGSITPPPRCSFVHAYKTLGKLAAGTTAHIIYGPDAASSDSGLWKMEVVGQGLTRNLSDGECAAWEKLAPR